MVQGTPATSPSAKWKVLSFARSAPVSGWRMAWARGPCRASWTQSSDSFATCAPPAWSRSHSKSFWRFPALTQTSRSSAERR